MHEAIVEKYLADYLPSLQAAKDESGRKSVLRLLVMQVARDTQQEAFRLAQDLASAIDQIHDEPPKR